MSIWLKKKLVLWFGGVLAVTLFAFAGSTLKAQGEFAKTPEEAAQWFGKLVLAAPQGESEPDEIFALKDRVVSARDFSLLRAQGIDTLLLELQKESQAPRFETSRTTKEGDATVVTISPSKTPKTIEVVTVPGDEGGYRVDLVATFAKNLHLGEGEYQTKIFALTDSVLPGLPDADSVFVKERVCRKNLREIQLALSMYTEDYDGRLPPAKKWTDVVMPYSPSQSIYNCPSAPEKKWGYAFNANLSGKLLSKIKNPTYVTTVYETSVFEPNAFGSGQKMDFRHKITDNGHFSANAALADGRVTYVSAQRKIDFGLNAKAPKYKK